MYVGQGPEVVYAVFCSEFGLHVLQALQLLGQVEGGQDWIPRTEGDQRAGAQRLVGIDPGLRVAQRVLLLRQDALIAPASGQAHGRN